MIVQEQQLFTEIFPVELDSLPPLSAYRLQAGRGDPDTLGWLLVERLQTVFGGHWVWARQRLLTDNPPNPVKLLMALETLAGREPRVFAGAALQDDAGHWPTSIRCSATP